MISIRNTAPDGIRHSHTNSFVSVELKLINRNL